jgi:hypothetical protein
MQKEDVAHLLDKDRQHRKDNHLQWRGVLFVYQCVGFTKNLHSSTFVHTATDDVC